MANADKKVKEKQKKNLATYQSKGHPEHFENEGVEFIEPENNKEKKEEGNKRS
ncbi:MAG: hypothetical protein K2X86_07630 [Cytophagaceae bacterium]|nr:hypothetical protein [Cytophagaceae bacterium]